MDRIQHGFIGSSPAMAKAIEFARKAARSDAPVLIQGESGTGKEILAQTIHRNSGRFGRPCLAVNCANLSAELLVSELFGHERGAFTGADRLKLGKFELANHGVLFLDEIGEMESGIQAKLLRALEQGEIERLGGGTPIKVDVRVIAATNRDLRAACKAGTFREDLYYRLNILPFKLPPLRERREDIPALVMHFIREFGEKTEVPVTAISLAAEELLCMQDWPGNVRQLRNVIQNAAVMGSENGIIEVEDLSLDLLAVDAAPEPGINQQPAAEAADKLDAVAHQAVRRYVLQAYEDAKGNRTKLAQIIGRHPKHLPRLLDKLGLSHLKRAKMQTA
jgi:two-component system response regulator AtoC